MSSNKIKDQKSPLRQGFAGQAKIPTSPGLRGASKNPPKESLRGSTGQAAKKSKVKTVSLKADVKSKVLKAKKTDLVEVKAEKKTKKVAEKTEKKVIESSAVIKKQVVGGKSPVAKVYDKEGKVVEELKLPVEIFAAKINPVLMAQAVRVYLANQRAGSASTKTRGEVTGSTRKIYRQKGTGRARHGGIRAPIFVGGGIVFGPRPRDFSLDLPKKMKRRALFSALSQKLNDEKIVIVENIKDFKPKTKDFMKMLTKLNLVNKKKKADRILLVVPEKINGLEKAARNIEGLNIEKAQSLNTYNILKNKNIVLLKESVNVLSNTFVKQ